MTTQSISELLVRFVRDPGGCADEVRERNVEVLEALAQSAELAELLDDSDVDAELLYDVLGSADEATSLIEDDESLDISTIIDGCLVAGASKQELNVVDRVDDRNVLFAATEAISTRIRRSMKRVPDDEAAPEWQADGDVALLAHDILVDRAALAREVARYTGEWARSGDSPDDLEPSALAFDLIDWARRCTTRVPGLLRHFDARVVETSLMLRRKPAKRWREPLEERWQPRACSIVPLDTTGVIVAKYSAFVCVVQINASDAPKINEPPFRRFVAKITSGGAGESPSVILWYGGQSLNDVDEEPGLSIAACRVLPGGCAQIGGATLVVHQTAEVSGFEAKAARAPMIGGVLPEVIKG